MTGDIAAMQQVIDRIYVVNLESRSDRHREMQAELSRIGLGRENPLAMFFKATRPDDQGPFPSIGARGCFLSQLGVLRHARDHGYRAFLLLEDDAAFTKDYIAKQELILRELDSTDWSLAYLGHRISEEEMPGPEQALTEHWCALAPDTRVECAHAVLFHQRVIGPLVDYLECMLVRPAGHSKGGPMHVDGAYSWFRRDHPEFLTLVTPSQYVVQRASRSDIASLSWKERLPFVAFFRSLKNRLFGRG